MGQDYLHHLVKEKGYTLDGAKEQLKLSKKKFEIIRTLEKLKTILINIKNELYILLFSKKNTNWHTF